MCSQALDLKTKLPPAFEAPLIRIKERAVSVWKNPRHRYYTDHKPERHSEVIIRLLNEILEDFMRSTDRNILALSNAEIFVLLASAYLHDVGMQWEKDPNLTLEKVRAIHEQLTYQMIIGSVTQSQYYPNLGVDYEYVDEIALVSKAHRGEWLWSEEYEPRYKAGEPMRLRLLAALLQLADKLDLDYTRVDLKKLKRGSIPKEARIHWWRCYYVESVNILNGFVNVMFEFPIECTYFEAICSSIRKQTEALLEKLQGVLWGYNIRLTLDSHTSPKFSPTKEAMPANDVRILQGDFLRSGPYPLDETVYQLELAKLTDVDQIDAVSTAVFLETKESETWSERLKGQLLKYPRGFLVLRAKVNSVSHIVGYAIYFPIKSEVTDLLLNRKCSYGDIKEEYILDAEGENTAQLVDYYIEGVAALRWVPSAESFRLVNWLRREIERKPFAHRIVTVCNTPEGRQLAEMFGLNSVWSFTKAGELHELRVKELTNNVSTPK